MKRYPPCRGFMLMDLLVGLGMALALLMAMTMAIGRLHRTQRELAEVRTTTRQLEQAAIALQTGAGDLDKTLVIEALPANPGATPPSGMAWARLSFPQYPGRTLTALVPAAKVTPGRAP